MKHFIISYTLLVISGLWLLKTDSIQPAIEHCCLGLAIISGHIIQLFDDTLLRTAAVLRDQDTLFAIEVTTACSAMQISWLYLAGILAYPQLNIKQKILSIIAGLLFIQSINIIRLISLVYIGGWFSFEIFDIIHTQFWPLLLNLMTLGCLVVVLFQTTCSKQETSAV